jgi:hypothetical protein
MKKANKKRNPVNGKISYLPILTSRKDGKLFVKEWLE